MTSSDNTDAIVEAALRVASARPWREATLANIASEANMSLAELSKHVASKSDILRAFMRQTDRRLLASLGLIIAERERASARKEVSVYYSTVNLSNMIGPAVK